VTSLIVASLRLAIVGSIMHMILVYDTTSIVVVSYSSIILSLYLLIFRISTQICVQDLFDINFSWYVRYDTVSTYDTLIHSFLFN
jgi:hypothetical protein